MLQLFTFDQKKEIIELEIYIFSGIDLYNKFAETPLPSNFTGTKIFIDSEIYRNARSYDYYTNLRKENESKKTESKSILNSDEINALKESYDQLLNIIKSSDEVLIKLTSENHKIKLKFLKLVQNRIFIEIEKYVLARASFSLEALLGGIVEKNPKPIGYIRKGVLDDFIKNFKISKYALEKMFYVAQESFKIANAPVESYWLLAGREYVEDIIIPDQTVTHASVKADPEAIMALKPEISDKKLNILGWGHSHADFGVFFSGTDESNQKTILHQNTNFIDVDGVYYKYCYGMTVNVHRDVYCRFAYLDGDNYHNVIAEYQIIDSGVDFDPEKEELDLANKIRTHEMRRNLSFNSKDNLDKWKKVKDEVFFKPEYGFEFDGFNELLMSNKIQERIDFLNSKFNLKLSITSVIDAISNNKLDLFDLNCKGCKYLSNKLNQNYLDLCMNCHMNIASYLNIYTYLYVEGDQIFFENLKNEKNNKYEPISDI